MNTHPLARSIRHESFVLIRPFVRRTSWRWCTFVVGVTLVAAGVVLACVWVS